MPDLPDLLFTRLRLLLDDSKGLTVVERMEKRGAARKHAKVAGPRPQLPFAAVAQKQRGKGQRAEAETGQENCVGPAGE